MLCNVCTSARPWRPWTSIAAAMNRAIEQRAWFAMQRPVRRFCRLQQGFCRRAVLQMAQALQTCLFPGYIFASMIGYTVYELELCLIQVLLRAQHKGPNSMAGSRDDVRLIQQARNPAAHLSRARAWRQRTRTRWKKCCWSRPPQQW